MGAGGWKAGGRNCKVAEEIFGVMHTFIVLTVTTASDMHKYVKSSQMYTLIIYGSLCGDYTLVKLSKKKNPYLLEIPTVCFTKSI